MACKNACGVSANVVGDVDNVKAEIFGFGLPTEWLADVLEKYGTDVLYVAVRALRLGLSKELVMELLAKLGPKVLELVSSLFNSVQNAGMSASVMDDDVINKSLLEMLVREFLPTLLEKYGDQLAKMLVDFVMKMLKDSTQNGVVVPAV